jgi:hypothetical protein
MSAFPFIVEQATKRDTDAHLEDLFSRMVLAGAFDPKNWKKHGGPVIEVQPMEYSREEDEDGILEL